MTVASRGRDPIGVCQGPGQGGDNFPLIAEPAEIPRLLADLHLAYVDLSGTLARPFRIQWLYGFGTNSVTVPITPAHARDIRIVDANGTAVFDSLGADAFNEWSWAGRLGVVEWLRGYDVLRLVFHTAWSGEDTPLVYDEYIEPTAAILDERTCWKYPPRLTGLQVGLTTVSEEFIEFQNGYNTNLVTGETNLNDAEARSTDVVFNAAPGGGSVGRFGPGCDDELLPAIRRINNIGPGPRGGFLLDASGCYRIQRPVLGVLTPGTIREVRVRNHALQVANDCGPCCECDDFIAVWEAIRRLRDRYAALVTSAQAARDQYHANRARWLENQQCREDDKLRLVVAPVCPEELGVAVGYCNTSDECLENLVIHISFQYEDMTADPCSRAEITCEGGTEASSPITAVSTVTGEQVEVVCQSTFRTGNTDPNRNKGCAGGAANTQREFYRLGGHWPHYWAHWNQVDPGAMAAATFRLRFSGTSSEDTIEAIADAFALGNRNLPVAGGSPVPGYVLGEGPVSTPEELHLVNCPKFASTGLVQDPCCESSVPGE